MERSVKDVLRDNLKALDLVTKTKRRIRWKVEAKLFPLGLPQNIPDEDYEVSIYVVAAIDSC